jgi:hypothetical protein
MATAPDITFRDSGTPSNVVSTLLYVQSSLGGNNIPVMQGENSNTLLFRIYNNWAKNSGIASAFNVSIALFDGIGVNTASTLAVSQLWVRMYENGYGESSGTPGLLSRYMGSDTAIGGNPPGVQDYIPEHGSDGSTTAWIRAGTDTNGVGFIEFATYAELPDSTPTYPYSFAITMQYEWSS